MATWFRKLLIRFGKCIPFFISFVLLVNYIEIIYAITQNITYEDMDGYYVYSTPISIWLSNIIYIDWIDVLLIWILCFSLELCKYAFRCIYLITLNLPFRWLVEHIELQNGTIIGLSVFMALFGLFCLYGGFKMIKYQKGKF